MLPMYSTMSMELYKMYSVYTMSVQTRCASAFYMNCYKIYIEFGSSAERIEEKEEHTTVFVCVSFFFFFSVFIWVPVNSCEPCV